MRTWTHAVPAAVGALTLAVALTGCNNSDSASRDSSGSRPSPTADDKTTYRLGEASPEQESQKTNADGAKFTVTPTKVQTGTKADMDNSGLEPGQEGPQIPVYVWTTLTHTSGPAMEAGDLDNDLVLRTADGERTKAVLVLMGGAKWPNCPETDTGKKTRVGKAEKVCSAFLVPEGQKPAAVELTQGYYKEPLEWPVK